MLDCPPSVRRSKLQWREGLPPPGLPTDADVDLMRGAASRRSPAAAPLSSGLSVPQNYTASPPPFPQLAGRLVAAPPEHAPPGLDDQVMAAALDSMAPSSPEIFLDIPPLVEDGMSLPEFADLTASPAPPDRSPAACVPCNAAAQLPPIDPRPLARYHFLDDIVEALRLLEALPEGALPTLQQLQRCKQLSAAEMADELGMSPKAFANLAHRAGIPRWNFRTDTSMRQMISARDLAFLTPLPQRRVAELLRVSTENLRTNAMRLVGWQHWPGGNAPTREAASDGDSLNTPWLRRLHTAHCRVPERPLATEQRLEDLVEFTHLYFWEAAARWPGGAAALRADCARAGWLLWPRQPRRRVALLIANEPGTLRLTGLPKANAALPPQRLQDARNLAGPST